MEDCIIISCLKKQGAGGAKGFCPMHYARSKKGKLFVLTRYDKRPAIIIGKIAKIPLGVNSKDGYAIVDKEYAWIDKYNWSLDNNGYPVSTYRGCRVHNIIKPSKKGYVIDHINRDKLDNRQDNLRYATIRQNVLNSAIDKRNISGCKGVIRVKNAWEVRITVNRKVHLLGTHKQLRDAINIRKKAEIKYLNRELV